VGEDELKWPEIFKACETVGGTEWYIVEYDGGSMEKAEENHRNPAQVGQMLRNDSARLIMRQRLFRIGPAARLAFFFAAPCLETSSTFKLPKRAFPKKSKRSEDFFADRAVRLFQIELSDAAMDSLRRGARQYVSGTVREGGLVLTNIGIHLKGWAASNPSNKNPASS